MESRFESMQEARTFVGVSRLCIVTIYRNGATWDIKIERNGIPNEFMIRPGADARLLHSVTLGQVKSSGVSLAPNAADMDRPSLRAMFVRTKSAHCT